jgi:N-acetylglutamate synthase-like GNAT family acetyltransferase
VAASLELRQAQRRDVAEIRAVAQAAYEPYVARIGRPPAPMTADYAAAVDRSEVWVAAADGAIAGLLVLVPFPDHLLLENVAVRPDAQGTGVGARLLALAEDQARHLGLTEIRLYTNVAMTENLAYYPRHGYTETHRAQGNGYSRVYFTKHLPAA